MFDYELPEDRIARGPARPRDSARLLVLDRASGVIAHRVVRDLPGLLAPGDLLIANDAKVMPARLRAKRTSGGAVEVLLLDERPDGTWRAMVGSRGRVKAGDRLEVSGTALEILSHEGEDWTVRIEGDARALMACHGEPPLPPYLRRQAIPADREDYQTVFARAGGAVAAPTAGMHFTPALIRALPWATLTLRIGPGTFRTRAGEPPDPEGYEIPESTVAAFRAATRVLAVGTTSARALETWASSGDVRGRTDLVILPGHHFRAVGALLTNFHLPGTSLLALVSAFAGTGRAREAYAAALREGYRFYSYGDAMLVT